MTYIALARKYRPQKLDEVVGQEHITKILKNAIVSGRLHHAFLFSGPRGVGKTSTARILAKSLNCKEGSTVNPCQKCSSCLEISENRSMDVIEIDGASNRGIDEIRNLRENVKFAPASSKFKIYIIDEVHMLTTEAFNALLKTLEEPPSFVKFIFATTQAHKVLATISSRCQRFDFRKISILEMIDHLSKISRAENISIEKDVLFTVAKASDGSLRDAESILDQLSHFTKDKINSKDAISVLGIIDNDILFDFTARLIKKDLSGILGLCDEVINQGKDAGIFINSLIEHFRNLMVVKVTKGSKTKLLDLPDEIRKMLFEQSNSFELEEIFRAFNIFIQTQEMQKRFDSVRIPLEISVIKLINPVNSEISLAKKKDELKISVATKTQKTKVIVEDTRDESSSIDIQEIKDNWPKIINDLTKVKMSVASYLEHAQPMEVKNNILNIGLPKDMAFSKEFLEAKDNNKVLEDVIFSVTNAKLRIKFLLSENIQQKKQEFEEIEADLKNALDTFGGRIVS
ncbi:MAG: DNA polymerase III subunit gamma/tau [Candidatus Omnitrophota bacterium]